MRSKKLTAHEPCPGLKLFSSKSANSRDVPPKNIRLHEVTKIGMGRGSAVEPYPEPEEKNQNRTHGTKKFVNGEIYK